MGEVVAQRDTLQQCWANLELENGDRVMISVAPSRVGLLNIPTVPSWVKVLKMKWAGMLPVATLWKSKGIAEIEEKFLDEGKPFQRPLDSIIDKLIDCRSAADVVVRLTQANIHAATTREEEPEIDLELLSKADAQAIFAMTRDEWTENVRGAVATGMATAGGTPDSGLCMNMVTETGLLSVTPDYSEEGKPDFIQVTVAYPSPPKHLSKAALDDAIGTATDQMKPEYKVVGRAEWIMQGLAVFFTIMPGD